MSIDFDAKLNSISSRAIDTQNVSEVAKQIFINGQSKVSEASLSEKFDLSKFKRVDLGLEVYGHQISSEKASQIAIRQAGLDIQLNKSLFTNVQYLNTQAAISRNKDMSEKVNGKIYVQTSSHDVDKNREVYALPKAVNVFDVSGLAKDKTGSGNSLNYHQAKNDENGEAKEDTTNLSIFA